MPASFWAGYLVKLAIVALILGALYLAGRKLRQGRLFVGTDRRLRVLETRMLSPYAAIYLLGVGTRYFLIGSSNAGVAKLAEVTAAELETTT
jgi:flagellar biogenesis protein FliO